MLKVAATSVHRIRQDPVSCLLTTTIYSSTIPHGLHLGVQSGLHDMTREQWREDWTSVSVVNNVLVTDPTI